MKKTHILAFTLSILVTSVHAATSADKAAELGQRLTPLGAERAGNAEGTIPAWTGGLNAAAGQRDSRGFLPDPYPEDRPLFIITAENKSQYQALLTPGQLAMFERYPKSYQMPVYPTRRSFSAPESFYQAAQRNALNAKLVANGSGLADFQGAYPFPVPNDALEVLWNHITRNRGGSVRRTSVQATPLPNGKYVPIYIDQYFTFRDQLANQSSAPSNILFYYKSTILRPSRLAGDITLVHETLDQVKEPRMAWIYNAGQRRVRRAPQVSYDGPYQASDGLRTSDNLDMFNGAPDRYDWALIGKREALIPYNNYRLTSPNLKYDDIVKPGHINPEHTRYELHRVWEIQAKLKPGIRHIYAQRRYLIDEDSWQIATSEHYDERGNLWRVGEGFQQLDYDVQVAVLGVEVLNDLVNGRYIVSGLINEENHPIEHGYKASASDYTPNSLANTGIR